MPMAPSLKPAEKIEQLALAIGTGVDAFIEVRAKHGVQYTWDDILQAIEWSRYTITERMIERWFKKQQGGGDANA